MGRPKAAPRKKPTQARAGATVDAILVAAAEAFRSRGFAKASVNAIAERAGVSVGSLYQYYPSKDALLAALAIRHTEGVLRELDELLAEHAETPLPLAVQTIVERMVAAHVDPLNRVLARGLDELGSAVELQADVDRRAGAAVARFLHARRAAIRPRNVELAALLLVRSVDLLTHAALEHHPASVDDGTLVEELTALALGYLSQAPNGVASQPAQRSTRSR